MYCRLFFYMFLFFSAVITAQNDSLHILREKNISMEISDTSKIKNLHLMQLPPRSLIIKSKDLNKIKDIDDKSFIIIDDTVKYTKDELASGLSEKELENYNKNKAELRNLVNLSSSEGDTYPTLSKIRKMLLDAKRIGAVIILILSLL